MYSITFIFVNVRNEHTYLYMEIPSSYFFSSAPADACLFMIFDFFIWVQFKNGLNAPLPESQMLPWPVNVKLQVLVSKFVKFELSKFYW